MKMNIRVLFQPRIIPLVDAIIIKNDMDFFVL